MFASDDASSEWRDVEHAQNGSRKAPVLHATPRHQAGLGSGPPSSGGLLRFADSSTGVGVGGVSGRSARRARRQRARHATSISMSSRVSVSRSSSARRDLVQQLDVRRERLLRALVRPVDDALHFGVDELRRLLATLRDDAGSRGRGTAPARCRRRGSDRSRRTVPTA